MIMRSSANPKISYWRNGWLRLIDGIDGPLKPNAQKISSQKKVNPWICDPRTVTRDQLIYVETVLNMAFEAIPDFLTSSN